MPEINGSTVLQARQNLSHTLLSNVRLHLFGQPDVVSQVDCTDGEQQDSSERFKLEPICSTRSKPDSRVRPVSVSRPRDLFHLRCVMLQLRPAVRVAANYELLRAVLLCGDGVAVHAEVIHQLAKERFVVCIAGTWDLTRSAAVGRCRSRSTCVDEDSSTNELHGEGGHQLLPIEDQDESEHNRAKDSKVDRTVLEVAGRAIDAEDHGRPE